MDIEIIFKLLPLQTNTALNILVYTLLVCHTNGDPCDLSSVYSTKLLVAKSLIKSSQSYPVQLPSVPNKGLSLLLKISNNL